MKSCFVIAPIGAAGSCERQRSDRVLTDIIGPACKECGYRAVRADHISEPGIITSQVVQRLVAEDMVVADLSGRNPNVFYELPVRHAYGRPAVLVIDAAEAIPFDVAGARAVQFNIHEPESVAAARAEVSEQIRAAEQASGEPQNPVTVAVSQQPWGVAALRQAASRLCTRLHDWLSAGHNAHYFRDCGVDFTQRFARLLLSLGLVGDEERQELQRAKGLLEGRLPPEGIAEVGQKAASTYMRVLERVSDAELQGTSKGRVFRVLPAHRDALVAFLEAAGVDLVPDVLDFESQLELGDGADGAD
jgi:hypothetical protein